MTAAWWRRHARACAFAAVLGALPGPAALTTADGSDASAEGRPPLLVAVDAENGDTRWSKRTDGRRRFLKILGVVGGLVVGEEVRCGASAATGERRDDAFFVARDAESGEVRWEVPVTGMIVTAGPSDVRIAPMGAWQGTTFVVEGRDGSVLGLERRTGRTRWRRDLGPFKVLGGTEERVLLGTGPEIDRFGVTSLVALNRRTGEIAWEYQRPTAGSIGAQTGLAEEIVAILENVGPPGGPATLRSFDARTGQQLWEQMVAPGGLELFVGESVIVVRGPIGGDASNAGFDALTGRQLWASEFLGLAPVREAGDDLDAILVLGGSFGGPPELVSVNPEDGSVRWTSAVTGPTLAASDEIVVQGAAGNSIVGIDAISGVERWRRPGFQPSGYDAVSSGDVVYFGGGCELLEHVG